VKQKIQRFIFRLICFVYPRFPVQRALWMVRLYVGEGLSQRRLAMLEEDARVMLRRGRQLDALRILHCALLLNPGAKGTERLAREITAKKWKMRSALGRGVDQESSLHHQIDLKMERFSWYVMRAVERGGFAKLIPPNN
jgi:hypothetical protein